MMVSVPAPPPMVASPPPCPACNSTAVARINESRIRIPTKIPYMRGARYLGCGAAHKLRPGAGIERRAAHQHTVQLVLGKKLGGVLQVHAAAVQDHVRRGGDCLLLQPASNGLVHFGSILWRRVTTRTDCPDGFVCDRHPSLAITPTQRCLELASDNRQGLARFALLQRFTHAQHRLQVGRECRGDLLAGLLVRLSEDVTPFGVADEGQPRSGLLGQWPGGRSRERALGLPIDVLGTDGDVPMIGDILRDRLDRHCRGEKPHRPLARDFAGRKECAQVLVGFDGPDVHLPVAREDQRSHASSNAATPGNSFPSRNSSDAPPPVETCVSLSSIPATAAAESPPPITVTAPFFPASTSAVAIARVPASNGGVSNTPIGPFQKIVFARSRRARKSCCVASSMSKTAQPLGIASADTERCSLARSSDGAMTATRGSRERMTSILPEILAPPNTATKGCLGLLSSWPRYVSSFSIRKPATAGLRRWATASVDAWAR